MSRRDVLRRIASLHRELAELYAELASDEAPTRRKPGIEPPPLEPDPSPDMTAKVRRNLRRQGVAA